MDEFLKFMVGVAVTITLGFGVSRFLDCAVSKPKRPESIKEDDWDMIFERYDSGNSIGFLERLLSLTAFWREAYTIIIGAWLAFKVIAKWETWKNIIQVPGDIKGYAPLVFFRARKAFGSWLLTRYLVGTLVNIIIGATGAYVGKQSFSIFEWLRLM
jgi:hypothetical protein